MLYPLDFFNDNWKYPCDKNIITYEGAEIVGADRETFEILEKGFSKDKNRVYKYSRPIPGSSPNNFKIN